MSELRESTKNMEVHIKIYDGGVENGDLEQFYSDNAEIRNIVKTQWRHLIFGARSRHTFLRCTRGQRRITSCKNGVSVPSKRCSSWSGLVSVEVG